MIDAARHTAESIRNKRRITGILPCGILRTDRNPAFSYKKCWELHLRISLSSTAKAT
jgi:hypothetical protein